jgi:hypothetical protein
MLHDLLDEILEIVARKLVAPGDEVDDVAATAASLAMTSKRLSKVMSPILWAKAASMAERLHPDPSKQAILSKCEPKTALKTDFTQLAIACGVPRARSLTLDKLEESLDKSDDIVGESCPIPRAAAAYILRMSRRVMAVEKAEIIYADRDLQGCSKRSNSYRFRDLRRAPPIESLVDVAETLAMLDGLFLDGKRPWWVRTQEDADVYFKRQELAEFGLPVCLATWKRLSPETMESFKSVCECLGIDPSAACDRSGPRWPVLRKAALDEVPELYRGCSEVPKPGYAFTASDVTRLRTIVAKERTDSREVPPKIIAEVLEESRQWRPAIPTARVMTKAALLHAKGLPIPVSWWKGRVEGETLLLMAEAAELVRARFNLPMHYVRDDFVTCAKTKFREMAPRLEDADVTDAMKILDP